MPLAKPVAVGASALVLLVTSCAGQGTVPSKRARETAEHARVTYADSLVATLADLVGFRTVHEAGTPNAEHPEFRAMTGYLEAKAAALGLDFADHGAVVVIGLGDSDDRLGLVTHGDVQPADPAKWASGPFRLDSLSEPGRLIGRGSEDDKGPIAAALYAMKAVKDRGVKLDRRIELIISYTEESDWQPFRDFLAAVEPPALNVALDSEYPVVVAEKGWNSVRLALPPVGDVPAATSNQLTAFSGGAFLSQIPEDASAVIAYPTPELEATLRAAAARDTVVRYRLLAGEERLTVEAQGRAAHSSKPETGRNAITHLAALLGSFDWPDSQAARMVRLVNDLVGLGHYAERFGQLATNHPFMGPLTLSLATLEHENGDLVAGISIRSPAGRSPEELERLIREALDGWQRRTGVAGLKAEIYVSAPHYLETAPHIPVLLDIFEHYTGQPDPQPISSSGGTHARLLPNGVNFGPSLPGVVYSGHTEHEFVSRDDLLLNLEMYTAMLVELAGAGAR